MADSALSALTAASALDGTELAYLVQGGADRKVTTAAIALLGLGSATLTGSTVTTNKPVFDLSQTWNAGAVVFTGLRFNATDTASASGSLLLDLQKGGSTQFSVDKGGNARVGNSLLIPNNIALNAIVGGVTVSATNSYSWGSTSVNSPDIFLYRDASGSIAQRNGTAAQTARVYNTYTDGSNYERGVLDWLTTPNVLTVGTQNAGTGSARNLQFVIGGTKVFDYGVTTANQWTIGYCNFTGSTGPILAGRTVLSSDQNIYGRLRVTNNQSGTYANLTVTNAGSLIVDGGAAGAYAVGSIITYPGTVASLTPAATVGSGARAFVTDATSTLAAGVGTTVAGGGSNKVPVYSDGTNWLIG